MISTPAKNKIGTFLFLTNPSIMCMQGAEMLPKYIKAFVFVLSENVWKKSNDKAASKKNSFVF